MTMKKKSYSVKALVQKAIIDSMNFSKRDGDQIFCSYSPHVNIVQFVAYKGGWEYGKSKLFDIYIYLSGPMAPVSVKEARKILKPIYDFIKENQKI